MPSTKKRDLYEAVTAGSPQLEGNSFFSHCTCVTSDRAGSPVAERGNDTIFLAGKLTWPYRAGARAVWTPRQQKHTQRDCRVTWLETLYTFTKTEQQDLKGQNKNNEFAAVDSCSVGF